MEEITKEARRTSKEPQALLASVKVKVQTEQKWQPWESSKVKSTAGQKEHKGSSHRNVSFLLETAELFSVD